jgi:RHH-type proline utilization regulon transcriptional repressor/proline dehydrogenase/delta 1-pyrroline-5-carboxylate dehydrogenase
LRAPLGVVTCISPWNFPLAIFLGQVGAALAAGNAVIAKPAEQTPLIAAEAVERLHDAGVPREALILLPGDGPSVGAPLVRHPAVSGVVFTGSTEVAQAINRSLAESGNAEARLVAETGGVNAMIVDSTALLEQAVSDAVASAFQSAGQRCSACRIVCVQEEVADRFCELLAGSMAELTVGDPAFLATDVGPVIDVEAKTNIERHIAEMERRARLIGRADFSRGEGAEHQFDGSTFIAPVAFEVARIADVKREVFGPVLHVVRFKNEALLNVVDDINALGYGLTMGLHTRIDETMHAVSARAKVGNLYINRNQIGAVVGVQPFGGEGLSGTGPKAGGAHYLDALARAPAAEDGRIEIISEPLAPTIDAALTLSIDLAKSVWSDVADRAAVLTKAAANASGAAKAVLTEAAAIAAALAQADLLPGPTGESNTMRLKARGAVLCLGPEERGAAQIARALGAGNVVVSPLDVAGEIHQALGRMGAVLKVDLPAGKVYGPLLARPFISAVAFDGARGDLVKALAARSGPIIPVLTSRDDPARYAFERTLTINTTAAGGDVRLLSLAE